MGRVDEAMRRAAEAVDAGRREAPPEPRIVLAELKGTNQERFPSEAPDLPKKASWTGPGVATRTEAGDPGALAERMLPKLAKKVVVDNDIDPVSREQYRRLATKLHAVQASTGLKVIAVSSALASEGKSLTASNLALTMSEAYQRSVLLVDADLRRPSIGQIFGLSMGKGLSDAVMSPASASLDLHRVTQHLSILLSGLTTVDPVAVLASQRMRQLIEEARTVFDWIVVDTPPIGLLSDANLVADLADGCLLVVKAETTPFDVVERAVTALGRERVLGVILNQASSAGPDNKYHGYYYTSAPRPVT